MFSSLDFLKSCILGFIGAVATTGLSLILGLATVPAGWPVLLFLLVTGLVGCVVGELIYALSQI